MVWKQAGRYAIPVFVFMLSGALGQVHAATPARWSEAKAQQWYAAQPWLVGANYIVVGRPIFKAPDPVAAARAIIADLAPQPAPNVRH